MSNPTTPTANETATLEDLIGDAMELSTNAVKTRYSAEDEVWIDVPDDDDDDDDDDEQDPDTTWRGVCDGDDD